MLMEVKNQTRVVALSVKYNIMKEMTNRVTFLTNVCFMILNNMSFVIQWLILFQLKDSIGGYEMNDVLLLWALAASSYGLAHIVFLRAFRLQDLIINGKLDAFLVQPKNVLISVISSASSTSAIRDLIYGYLLVILFHGSISKLLLFTYFTITGAIILAAFAVLVGSISFWIVRGDMLATNLNNAMINFSTYPDGIFKEGVRVLLYSLVPVGMVAYLPVKIILSFHWFDIMIITVFAVFITLLAFVVFYKGLRRYSSSNLMSARS